jgi:transcriptional regulator with XRE-family HTH domain
MLTIGNQLKAARALAGLSQAQLAAAAGLNVTTISAMEGKGAATLGSGPARGDMLAPRDRSI